MSNSIFQIGNSMIQHDKNNNRVYLMKLNKEDASYITSNLDEISQKENYTKIIAKIPCSTKQFFIEKNYVQEARIPNLYKGNEDGIFMAKYLSKDRCENKEKNNINKVLNKALDNKNNKKCYHLKKEFYYRKAQSEDAKIISEFYKSIFKTYPFPIHDYRYILETMNDNVIYFTVWNNNKLIAISSAEMDEEKLNAEMTDFGTTQDYRGQGLANYLLDKMEHEMKEKGIKTVYSIARSVSYGMNLTFSKNGYEFGGTLINNTNIFEGIESMNVWYKEL